MLEALEEAKKAQAIGEVPIGAIIEKDGEIIGRGHNMTESLKDPTAHAEMMAIKDGLKNTDGYRLTGCNMYVTVEPCTMCIGALILSRISKLYIGAMDQKAGACGSVFNIPIEEKLNHTIEIHTGIMKDECQKIIKDFFKQIREDNK